MLRLGRRRWTCACDFGVSAFSSSGFFKHSCISLHPPRTRRLTGIRTAPSKNILPFDRTRGSRLSLLSCWLDTCRELVLVFSAGGSLVREFESLRVRVLMPLSYCMRSPGLGWYRHLNTRSCVLLGYTCFVRGPRARKA